MFMRRILMGVLAFGAVAGYASGFASLGWHASHCHQQRRAAFEEHVAEVCTRAAERVHDERAEERFERHHDHHGARPDLAPAAFVPASE
jgi:hypothetical protein